MLKHTKVAVVCGTILTLCGLLLAAEQPKQIPPAPIPAQVLNAKKVFVGNAGGDQHVGMDEPSFEGGPQRTYDQFYAAMKEWGHYELVGSPADADLLFEIGLAERNRWGGRSRGYSRGKAV